jgi:hypothetical protein
MLNQAKSTYKISNRPQEQSITPYILGEEKKELSGKPR